MSIVYEEIGASNGQPRTSTQGADWKRTYTRHWQAETDSAAIGPKAVREACPVAIGQPYDDGTETDPGSFCQSISVTEDTEAADGLRWLVTAEYGPLNVLEFSVQAPLDQRPTIRFDKEVFQEPATKDIDDEPVVNSAGDPFDPPIMLDRRWPIMQIVRNEPSYSPLLANDYCGTINNAEWFGRPAKEWKCLDITGEEAVDPDGHRYWVVSYVFQLKRDTWVERVMDVGYNELDDDDNRIKILDKNGSPVGSPWPLNEDGTKKAAGEAAEFLEFKLLPEVDFSIFNLDTFYNDLVTSGLLS